MKLTFVYKGSASSGFHGHAGRPGEVGGSSSGRRISPTMKLTKTQTDFMAMAHRESEFLDGTEFSKPNNILLTEGVMSYLDYREDNTHYSDMPGSEKTMWRNMFAKAIGLLKDNGINWDRMKLEFSYD